MLRKYADPLKIASLVVMGVGYLIHNELQKRETEELVEKVLDKREADKEYARNLGYTNDFN